VLVSGTSARTPKLNRAGSFALHHLLRLNEAVPTTLTQRRILFCVLVCASFATAFVTGACRRDAEQSLTRAVEAWDSGDYKLAAEEYERYLYQRPTGDKAPEARFQLANIYYFKLQRYDQARVNYTAFIEQNPSSPNAQLARERLAEVLGEMGRSFEAIAEYENLNPQEAGERRRIRLRIADLYFAQRNYSQALTEYEKVIEKVPYDELTEQAYLREASVYHIERSQYLQALPVYEKLTSMSADPKVRLRAAYGTAECYAGLYRFDEAIKTLRTIKEDSEQADVSRRVAELELRKREAIQAGGGLQPVGKKQEPAKQETAVANKAEAPPAMKAEKAGAGKSDKAMNSKPEKAETAKAENANKRNRRSRKNENTQTGNSLGNSNVVKRTRSRKTDNAQAANAAGKPLGNSNVGKRTRSKRTDNAQATNSLGNSNVVKRSRSKKTDNAKAENSNGPKRSRPKKSANANR
jgi:tetratricopeptide (TPR) repeat protein